MTASEKNKIIRNDNQYIKIIYSNGINKGCMKVKESLYWLNQKKFEKSLKGFIVHIEHIPFTEYLMHYVALRHRQLRSYIKWKTSRWNEKVMFDENGHIYFKEKEECQKD